MAMQSEESTFLEEPVDSADFESWKSSFDLSEKEDEIDSICRGNPSLKAILLRLVPQSLSFDTFWSRYFYKLHKLTHIHHARTRIIANLHHSHDPDLTWELEEEEEEDDNKEKEPPEPHKQQVLTTTMQKDKQKLEKEEEVIAITERNESVVKDVPKAAPDDKSKKDEDEDVDVKLVEPEEKKVSHGDDKLVGAAAKPPSPKKTTSKKEEDDDDDLGWDEIGDLGEMDDAKVIITTTSNDALRKSDLRKKLAAQDDDDEDLSWDVEDDH